MTKIQKQFRLVRPLDEPLLERVSNVHSIYGILRVQVAPSLDRLMVEYDATRLRPEEVDMALAQTGIPVEPTVP
jgi:hypothetical protein